MTEEQLRKKLLALPGVMLREVDMSEEDGPLDVWEYIFLSYTGTVKIDKDKFDKSRCPAAIMKNALESIKGTVIKAVDDRLREIERLEFESGGNKKTRTSLESDAG